MASSEGGEIAEFVECLRDYGPKAFHNSLTAILIWLFGNLVFIPLAVSINWQTKFLCSLIFFIVFTFFIYRAFPGVKKLIDAFSFFPAKKYGMKSGLNYESSLKLFRYTFYIILSLILYALYFPFLTNFHPAVSGLVLIMVLIGIFFLLLRICFILSSKILAWLSSS